MLLGCDVPNLHEYIHGSTNPFLILLRCSVLQVGHCTTAPCDAYRTLQECNMFLPQLCMHWFIRVLSFCYTVFGRKRQF
jgi:hypothetical protein